MREAAFKASVTIHANVFGVDWSIPLFEHSPPSSQPHAAGPGLAADSKAAAAPAPSAEVAELQRRLAASGDADVIGLMTPDPAQLDPLDTRGISRWLQAKGRDMDLAEEHIHTHAKWRQAFMPAGHILEEQIPNELASGKVFLQGRDTQGRAVFVVLAKQQEKGRPEETKRCICYTLDNAIAACDPVQNELGQFVCLFDLSGLRAKNLDVGALQAVFEVLQQHYPERLGELWFLNAPFIFWGLWRIVSPFIQPATKDKIKFLSGNDRENMLHQYIPQDVLPQQYGGEADMIPIEDAVHARLEREGQQRARQSIEAQIAEEIVDAEGRLTRAGRAVQRWASATADFGRRHNPVNGIRNSHTLNRLKGWRPFSRDEAAVSYKDEATSTRPEGQSQGSASQLEGGVGQLVHFLMPQVLFVAIFQKARQAFWWAWSHAARIKSLQTSQDECKQPIEPFDFQTSLEMDDVCGDETAAERQQARYQQPLARRRKSIQAHRLSLSCQRYTSEVAARVWRSINDFDYLDDINPEDSPQSHSLDSADSASLSDDDFEHHGNIADW